MKKKQLNKEEQLFREKLNELNFDYNPADWDALEKQLPKGKASSWMGTKSIVSGIAAAVVIGAGIYYFNQQSSKNTEEFIAPIELSAEEIASPVKEPKQENIDKTNVPSGQQKLGTEEKPTAVKKQNDAETSEEIEATEWTNPENTEEVKTTEYEQEELTNEQTDAYEKKYEEFIMESLNLPLKVCPNSEYQASIAAKGSMPEGWTLDWLLDGQLINEFNGRTSVDLKEDGARVLEVQLKDEEGKLISVVEKEIELAEIPVDQVDFSYADLKDPYNDLVAEMQTTSTSLESFKWTIEGGTILEGEKVSHAFKEKGVYDVKLEAITSDGCSVEISKPIAIEIDFDPLAPNAFTPDQNGMNDTFIPEAFKDRNDRFKMEIFSLNGELIYRTLDNSAAWNGHFNNTGRLMDEGIYVWKVMISNAEGKEKSFAGNVRIIQQ